MSASNRREDRIAVLAYQYWVERGRPLGTPEVDWYRAVATLGADEGLVFEAFHYGPNTAMWAPRRRGHG